MYRFFDARPERLHQQNILPEETPKPRAVRGFWHHMRPASYPAAAVHFSNTWYLGFLAIFLLVIETITGILLMVYYLPTPEDAYGSILRIMNQLPFGSLLRDLHRLAGEVLLAVVILHLLRVIWTGSYKAPRRRTWQSGILLLGCTLGLAFTGYLLPWDQVAYWAVSVGTSIVAQMPMIGAPLGQLLRGGQEIGGDGLLRFYLLHVLGLPLSTLVLLARHYYRVSRVHGISSPPLPGGHGRNQGTATSLATDTIRIPLIPGMVRREIPLLAATMLVLFTAARFYDAPLAQHADPLTTPLQTQAPWFFLWAQGLLKLGPPLLMGFAVPLLLALFLYFLPLLDRTPRKPLHRRAVAMPAVVTFCCGLMALSLLGTHHFHNHISTADQVLLAMAPEQGEGPLSGIVFADLPVGLFRLAHPVPQETAPAFRALLDHYHSLFAAAQHQGFAADAEAVLLIEDWQADLKRINLRLTWSREGKPMSAERTLFLHRQLLPGAHHSSP